MPPTSLFGAAITSVPADREQGGTRRHIQGVEYVHTVPGSGGDLFLTRWGLPFARLLQPEHWLEPVWFAGQRRRLRGTSTIYASRTRGLEGRALEIVVRYNRMGEDLPVDTVTLGEFPDAEFNTPFEEVAAVMALRRARIGPRRGFIATKRPLAIYSPPERRPGWQTGRDESRMAAKQTRLPDFQLDGRRQYLLLYGWIKGIDVQDAADRLGYESGQRLIAETMAEVQAELGQAGFRVLDMKPAHIIVRFTANGQLRRRRDGRLMYALVDYELLEPIPGWSGSG